MWNRRWLFLTEVFFWGSLAPEEKYRGPKQSPTNSHNDRKIDGAKLSLSLIIALLDILMHFRCNLWRNTLFNLFLHSLFIYPCERISICPAMKNEDHRLNWYNARVLSAVCTLVPRFKRKHTWRSWHHDLESIRHDLESLCFDNDPRCHMRKIKIISSDWIALLRRLLIIYKAYPGYATANCP